MEANNMTAKRMILGVVGVAAGAWLFSAVPVLGHHAFTAEFDAARPIKVEGTLTRVDWVNPHSWLYLDVKKQDGTVEKWMFEGLGPSGLIRRGITRDHLKPGTELTIEGSCRRGRRVGPMGVRLFTRVVRRPGHTYSSVRAARAPPRDGNDPTEQQ